MTANLKPVDFKAVAAKGAYVYCYLREDGTPYYVGMASFADRPYQKHSCPLPAYNALIRVMRSGLTREQAADWERFYIKHYGRQDLGTGMLRNMTDGGDGAFGAVRSETFKQAVSDRCKGVARSAFDMRGIQQQAEERKQAAAEKYGCTKEAWSKLTSSQRGACRSWIADGSGRTAAQWIERKTAGLFGAKERAASRAYASLQSFGLTLAEAIEITAKTTARQREQMKRWLQRNPSASASEYLASRNLLAA